MRIISGTLKGRSLEPPAGANLRPTMDRVRGAIFSSLTSNIDIEHFAAVDLYAGTGALGFEALSRGAIRCCFVERDKALAARIRQRAEEFHVDHQTRVIVGDVIRSLREVASYFNSPTTPRLFLIDPPYTEHPEGKILLELVEAGLVVASTVIVLGTPTRLGELAFPTERLAQLLPQLAVEQQSRRYGDTTITTYFVTG